MASVNVSLPDPMRAYVQARIDSGQYENVSDYVRDLIRRDQRVVANDAEWLQSLDASIEATVGEMAAGSGVDLDAACDAALADPAGDVIRR